MCDELQSAEKGNCFTFQCSVFMELKTLKETMVEALI